MEQREKEKKGGGRSPPTARRGATAGGKIAKLFGERESGERVWRERVGLRCDSGI